MTSYLYNDDEYEYYDEYENCSEASTVEENEDISQIVEWIDNCKSSDYYHVIISNNINDKNNIEYVCNNISKRLNMATVLINHSEIEIIYYDKIFYVSYEIIETEIIWKILIKL